DTSITRAWIAATDELTRTDGDAFSLIVSITDPSEPAGLEAAARKHLDRVLIDAGLQDTQAVANTIFPIAVAKGRSAQQLYDTYSKKTYSVLRRFPQNRRGTYFLRMIKRDKQRLPGVVSRNPLDEVISKMRGELERGTRILRSAYELAIYDPIDDANVR